MASPPGPRVSVLMATYNQAGYLAQALDSVLAQDLDPHRCEVIVIDDGSTDDTPAILAGHAGRLVALREPHRGLAAACNVGLARVRGEYFTRLDSDDFVAPAWLRRQAEVLDHHPEACGVYPRYVRVRTDGTHVALAEEGRRGLFRLPACGVLLRTEAVRAVGGYRPLYWEEYDLYLRLHEQGPFVELPEPLYFYRENPSGLTALAEQRRAGWRELLAAWGPGPLQAAGSCPELEDAIAALAPSPGAPA